MAGRALACQFPEKERPMKALKGTRTHDNLKAAFAGESQANRRYLYFAAKADVAGETHEYTDMYPGMAKQARDEGFGEIADWFETLAKAERSHANRFQKALDGLSD